MTAYFKDINIPLQMRAIETIYPSRKFYGNPLIPGDKSISHRGLICGALAKGRTEIIDILESEDVNSTARCLRQLGVPITQSGNRTFIDGLGDSPLTQPTSILNCGNSGTTFRLLLGILAGQKIQATLTGDQSLCRRPMKRVADPLTQMGAQVVLTHEDYPPLTVLGNSLQSIDYNLKVASAQVKSAIIFAALSAKGTTCISGKIQSRDHTERMLRDFGVDLITSPTQIQIKGGQVLKPTLIQVPGDPSTAAFWIAAASIIPSAQLRLENISLNPTRLGFLRAMQRMGAHIEVEVTSDLSEPLGRIQVSSAPLRGIQITKEEIPSLIDEIPLLAVIATQAEGISEIAGAEELRVKESDRIEAVATNLRSMGAEIEVSKDGFRIKGIQKLKGAQIESYHDHRIAMAFSIAALVARGTSEILNPECTQVSYPNFFSTLRVLSQ